MIETASESILKNVIFFGGKVNHWVVQKLNGLVPLNEIQNTILLYTIYLVMLYVVISFAEGMKKPLKIVIVGLLLFLLVGFFKF